MFDKIKKWLKAWRAPCSGLPADSDDQQVRRDRIEIAVRDVPDGVGFVKAAEMLKARGVLTVLGMEMTASRLNSYLRPNLPHEVARIKSAKGRPPVPALRQINRNSVTPVVDEDVDRNRFVAMPLAQFLYERGIKMSRHERAYWGKILTDWCKKRGKTIGRISSEQWGHVNAYPIEVLEEFSEGLRL